MKESDSKLNRLGAAIMKQIEQPAAVATISELRKEESFVKLTAIRDALREAGRTTPKIEELSAGEEIMKLAQERIAILTKMINDVTATDMGFSAF